MKLGSREEWQIPGALGDIILVRWRDSTAEERQGRQVTPSVASGYLRSGALRMSGGDFRLRMVLIKICHAVGRSLSYDRVTTHQLKEEVCRHLSHGQLVALRGAQPVRSPPIHQPEAKQPEPGESSLAGSTERTCWVDLDVFDAQGNARTGATVKLFDGNDLIATATVGDKPRVHFGDLPEASQFRVEVEGPQRPTLAHADTAGSEDENGAGMGTYC